MKDELRSQESMFSLEIRKISEERDRHLREVAVQKTYVEETHARIADLETSCRELKLEIENQGESHNERLNRIANEQDQVTDPSLVFIPKVHLELDFSSLACKLN